ncbi:MBL fold metallo-hydrolase [Veillonella sp. VA142]|uniref:MBL fold metallo-hydrolase n=1 Tax=Veillonella sp. VA142 TaxID=741834 RepID=UPI000F8E1BFD|nr:MBL fold metallo-hydrolase [Veillonella sp. VA142]
MKVTYLEHSGFVIEDGKQAYIFDYWKDPADVVDTLVEQGYELHIFISHIHHDHYMKSIFKYLPYIHSVWYHEDVPALRDACQQVQDMLARQQDSEKASLLLERINNVEPTEGQIISEERLTEGVVQQVFSLHSMKVGDTLEADGLTVTMFGSTDAGGSFLVDTGTHRIFHAGDLNWWHWSGDTPENIAEAKALKEKEFAPLTGLSVDIMMFPVDARLEVAREWGALEVLGMMNTKLFIPMHANGPVWVPSEEFRGAYPTQQCWIPREPGDTVVEEVK